MLFYSKYSYIVKDIECAISLSILYILFFTIKLFYTRFFAIFYNNQIFEMHKSFLIKRVSL